MLPKHLIDARDCLAASSVSAGIEGSTCLRLTAVGIGIGGGAQADPLVMAQPPECVGGTAGAVPPEHSWDTIRWSVVGGPWRVVIGQWFRVRCPGRCPWPLVLSASWSYSCRSVYTSRGVSRDIANGRARLRASRHWHSARTEARPPWMSQISPRGVIRGSILAWLVGFSPFSRPCFAFKAPITRFPSPGMRSIIERSSAGAPRNAC